MKHILAINDEADYCYREKLNQSPGGDLEGELKGDEKKEAEKNNEAARQKGHQVTKGLQPLGL